MELSCYMNSLGLTHAYQNFERTVKECKPRQIFSDLLPLLELSPKTVIFLPVGHLISYAADLNWSKPETPTSLLKVGYFVAYFAAVIFPYIKWPRATALFSAVTKIHSRLTQTDSKIVKLCTVTSQSIYLLNALWKKAEIKSLTLLCHAVSDFSQATNGFTTIPSSLKKMVILIVGCSKVWECVQTFREADKKEN